MEAWETEPRTGRQALRLLMEGNQRWATGAPTHPHGSVERRDETAQSQTPFAVVVTCVDSRVAPELIFDRGIGDILVVRTAAHALDRISLGSVRFGPTALGTPLILVLGHQRCGAVAAAIEALERPDPVQGPLQHIVEALRPATADAAGLPGDVLDNVVHAQTRRTVDLLLTDSTLEPLIRDDKLLVAGGYYSLDKSEVTLHGPAQNGC